MKRKLFFECQVAALCDADKRKTHKGTGFVARAASVHAMAEAHSNRCRRFQRMAERMVR